jgi:hypothetical protein
MLLTETENHRVKYAIVIRSFGIILCSLSIGISVLSGCHTASPENEIKSEIIKYFEAKHYKVINIKIGTIESIMQHEKVYMGTEGYIVKLKSLTLETTRQNPHFEDTRGLELVYKNGIIRIKISTNESQKWIITDVSNIPVL